MAIGALAVLKISKAAVSGLPAAAVVHVLDDGAVVRADPSFAKPPAELYASLRALAETALAGHEDPRGVLFVPDVPTALATGSSYASWVDALGVTGHWSNGTEVVASRASEPPAIAAAGATAGPDLTSLFDDATKSILEKLPDGGGPQLRAALEQARLAMLATPASPEALAALDQSDDDDDD